MTLTNVIVKDTIKAEDLIELSSTDCDFSGENGEEYTNDEALDAGYSSNAEYYANKIANDASLSDEEKLNAYVDQWLEHDNYYGGYVCELVEVNENTKVLSLAVYSED